MTMTPTYLLPPAVLPAGLVPRDPDRSPETDRPGVRRPPVGEWQ